MWKESKVYKRLLEINSKHFDPDRPIKKFEDEIFALIISEVCGINCGFAWAYTFANVGVEGWHLMVLSKPEEECWALKIFHMVYTTLMLWIVTISFKIVKPFLTMIVYQAIFQGS